MREPRDVSSDMKKKKRASSRLNPYFVYRIKYAFTELEKDHYESILNNHRTLISPICQAQMYSNEFDL